MSPSPIMNLSRRRRKVPYDDAPPRGTRKPSRLQSLYKKVTKNPVNMAITGAIFATIMSIVGLFVTSKGAPLSNWITTRDLLMKNPVGMMLAPLLQKLIDLVCRLLSIGVYPGCIVEFKDTSKDVIKAKKLSKLYPVKSVTGEALNTETTVEEYIVVAVVGDYLHLKKYDDVVTMENLKSRDVEHKLLMITNATIYDSSGVPDKYATKPTKPALSKHADYAKIPRHLMKRTGKCVESGK